MDKSAIDLGPFTLLLRFFVLRGFLNRKNRLYPVKVNFVSDNAKRSDT